jgi:hypothetical protein
MLKTVGVQSVRTGNQTINNGDLIIGTAGDGIDFSANTNAPGMTSELLNWYEEGTWSPTYSGWVSNPTVVSAQYTRIGRQVTLTAKFFSGVSANGSLIFGIPFTSNSTGGGAINASTESDPTVPILGLIGGNATYVQNINAATLTSNYWFFSATYFV